MSRLCAERQCKLIARKLRRDEALASERAAELRLLNADARGS
mgnify:CR=1 FL=1